jgi:prevent-host-death family protein
MTTYTYSEARQNFAAVLDKAKKEGKVLIKKRDGSSFVLSPLSEVDSPLNVKGIKINLTAKEIVDVLKEVRRR